MPKTQESVYRPIFLRALALAWKQKELWPFAILAGLAGSGVVINDLLAQAQLALSPRQSISVVFGGEFGAFVTRYMSLVLSSGTNNILLSAVGAIAILASGFFLVVICQQLLLVALHKAAQKKSPLSGRALLQSLKHHHFARIAGVDLLGHVSIYLVLGGGAVLIRTLAYNGPLQEILPIFLAAATLFFAFILNILFMLTLVAVGEERVRIATGFLEAVDRFLRYPLVACESALLIFAVNFAVTLVYVFGLMMLAVPFGMLFAEALTQGSLLGVSLITAFGALVAAMFTICAAGFMTTFTYAVWVLLTDQLNRAPFGSRFHHYVRRRFTKK